MTNDERENTPDSVHNDDIRFAPPPADEDETPAADSTVEPHDEAEDEAPEPVPFRRVDELDMAVTEGMDIEAALAAVSTLSDMVAEQEAAEQARIAQVEADAQAAAERQARMEHPELFFPVPPMTSLHRGQVASVLPALLLIGIGAWLTFTLTTTQAAPNAGLLALIVAGSIGVVMLVRWLASGRWARGSLFFGIGFILSAIILFYLLQPSSPGLGRGWPGLLIAFGVAAGVSGLLASPRDRRLFLPGIALIVAGVAGLIVTLGLMGDAFVGTAGTLWPAALAVVALVCALPLIVRRRG